MSSIKGNKKFLILVILAGGLAAAAVTSFASAQNTTNLLGNTTSSNNGTQSTSPLVNNTNNANNTQAAITGKIVGTISMKQAAKNFLNENVKVTLADASSKAASQANGMAVGGRLCVVQGYLVYTITVANMNNGTLHKVIVDAGNGSVLYTSPPISIDNSSLGRMMDGTFGYGIHEHHHRHHHHHHHDE
jgi:uncharacterized membrane protein YkoI